MVSMLFVGCARQDGVDESGEGMHVVLWQRREELGDGFFPGGGELAFDGLARAAGGMAPIRPGDRGPA